MVFFLAHLTIVKFKRFTKNCRNIQGSKTKGDETKDRFTIDRTPCYFLYPTELRELSCCDKELWCTEGIPKMETISYSSVHLSQIHLKTRLPVW